MQNDLHNNNKRYTTKLTALAVNINAITYILE